MGAASECSCAGQAAEAPVAAETLLDAAPNRDEYATLHEDCPTVSACAGSRFWRKRVVCRRFTSLRAVGIYIVTATMMHHTVTAREQCQIKTKELPHETADEASAAFTLRVLPSNATVLAPEERKRCRCMRTQSNAAVQQATTGGKLRRPERDALRRVASREEKRYGNTVMEKTLITCIQDMRYRIERLIKLKKHCTHLSAGEAGSSLVLKPCTATRCDQASQYRSTQGARSKAACVMSGAV